MSDDEYLNSLDKKELIDLFNRRVQLQLDSEKRTNKLFQELMNDMHKLRAQELEIQKLVALDISHSKPLLEQVEALIEKKDKEIADAHLLLADSRRLMADGTAAMRAQRSDIKTLEYTCQTLEKRLFKACVIVGMISYFIGLATGWIVL